MKIKRDLYEKQNEYNYIFCIKIGHFLNSRKLKKKKLITILKIGTLKEKKKEKKTELLLQ